MTKFSYIERADPRTNLAAAESFRRRYAYSPHRTQCRCRIKNALLFGFHQCRNPGIVVLADDSAWCFDHATTAPGMD